MSLPLTMKAVCISLVLVLFIVIPGCITTSPGAEKTTPVTSLYPATASPVPAPSVQSGQSIGIVQLTGNVYGLSSDPLLGIDTITFSIGLPAHASAVDLTGMILVFSSGDRAPVTLLRGAKESASSFTTTTGGIEVTALQPGEEVDISFRVKPVSGGNTVNIELRPPGGTAVSISGKVPVMISSMNVL
jgi:hypothetical protein